MSQTPPPINSRPFDRTHVRRNRQRRAGAFADFDFLFRETGARLAGRLDDVKRRFPLALDLGCHSGLMAGLLAGRNGIKTVVSADLAPAMAVQAPPPRLAADEEQLPFRDACFDLVVSNLSLHWVNDLPGALVQIRRALKPDGLFLGAMLGGGTLGELRRALTEAELQLEGGAGPRISPMADVRDAGNLLTRAGFALPVADADDIRVSYPDPMKLMADLRGMGEANAVAARRKTTMRRATLMRAAEIYQARDADADGRVPATFGVIYMTGWAPDVSQPKPLRPGSGETSLADVLSDAPGTGDAVAHGDRDG